MDKFCKAAADVLEVESVTPETHFREVEGWCSLMAFGLLVMMENDWKAPLTIEEFMKRSTIRDLMRDAMASLAARILGMERSRVLDAQLGSTSEWDSVNHLRLVMEAEKLFGFHYPIERIPELRTIDDFLTP